jgi:hypothetical protein
VVDLDAALGGQLLDVAVGEAKVEIPADREVDHLRVGSRSRRRQTVGWERDAGGEFS